ncbi:MAG: hypothetical protein ACREUK_07350 [Burkholderiales bacterium]
MILGWFDTAEVDALADRMAKDLVRRVPPSSVDDQDRKAAANREKRRDSIRRQVRDFTSKHRLNLYKKARLANRFKWALHDAGYSKALVDEMTLELATVMATTQSRSH